VDKRTRRRVKALAVFLVFLSVAVTVFEVGRNRPNTVNEASFKESRAEFTKLKWMNKAAFDMGSPTIIKALNDMNSLVSSVSTKTIRRETRGAYGIYTFSVPMAVYPSLRERLQKVGGIISESETQDTSLVSIDPTQEESTLASLQKDLAELDKIQMPSEHDLRQKDLLRSRISYTKSRLDNINTASSYLVYITLKPTVKSNTVITSVKTMGITFLKWLAIFFVGMVLVYYGTKLLMWLLGMMGVKGISAGGVGSSYQYGGYGNYANKYYSRYGYGGSHRKVKRVYKDKRTTESDENPPE